MILGLTPSGPGGQAWAAPRNAAIGAVPITEARAGRYPRHGAPNGLPRCIAARGEPNRPSGGMARRGRAGRATEAREGVDDASEKTANGNGTRQEDATRMNETWGNETWGNETRENETWENGAGDGNRTHVFSLEGCCSTIELHPHAPSYKRPAGPRQALRTRRSARAGAQKGASRRRENVPRATRGRRRAYWPAFLIRPETVSVTLPVFPI